MNIFQMKIFQKIILYLFKIYSYIELNVLVTLPKNFHGQLNNDNTLQLAH